MFISVELSLYPLTNEPVTIIREYIKTLQSDDQVEVACNRMSTQLFGEYDQVMALVQAATKQLFLQAPTAVLISKIINSDRRPS